MIHTIKALNFSKKINERHASSKRTIVSCALCFRVGVVKVVDQAIRKQKQKQNKVLVLNITRAKQTGLKMSRVHKFP